MSTALGSAVTRMHWRHPEWCAVAVSAIGWLGLLASAPPGPVALSGAHASPLPTGVLGHAALMATAMMAPQVLDQVHRVATFSLWPRRYRAAAGFLLGYLGVWTLVGALMIVAASGVAGTIGVRPAIVTGFAVAVAAALTPGRRRRLRQCLSTRPLAPRGWRADRDTVVHGGQVGCRSVVSCWSLMLATTVTHSLVVMAAATLIAYAEVRSPQRSGIPTACRLALLGLLALALASPGSTPAEHVHTT